MAEVILNALANGKYEAHSAGSHPAGEVNPAALSKLHAAGHETSGLRSKSWNEFERSDATAFDYVITVCDNAARESCPVRVGSPTSLHWSILDPASGTGSDDEIRHSFDDAYTEIEKRIIELVSDSL